jgi:SpoVK/Ycf46/Vps4 family AAA+-type ATPase
VLSQHHDYGRGSGLVVDVVTPPGEIGAEIASRVFEALERQLSKGSCYRGRVLSLEAGYQWSGHAERIRVHDLEPVTRDEVILPERTLAAVERNVIRFAEHRPSLRAMGLSTQKGLLFHGAPGTGKTHCIRYLAGQLPGHTTLLITAEQVALLPEYMALARLLQPALVVIEDADLIARDRSARDSACDEVMLNRLLNELDGLRERADVFFILTTNRPETLEPALASRPGRIDQAIEFPLPDESLRRRLIALYARSLPVPSSMVADLARRTRRGVAGDCRRRASRDVVLRRRVEHAAARRRDRARERIRNVRLSRLITRGYGGQIDMGVAGEYSRFPREIYRDFDGGDLHLAGVWPLSRRRQHCGEQRPQCECQRSMMAARVHRL